MGKDKVETVLRVGLQYLNPEYNENAPAGLPAQKTEEKGVIYDAMDEVTKDDPEAKKIWNIIKKIKR